MSDTAPLVRSKPGLALLFLILSFSAGLLLVYSRAPNQPPAAAPGEIGGGPATPSTTSDGRPVTELDLDAALTAVRIQLADAQTRILRLEHALASMRAQAQGDGR